MKITYSLIQSFLASKILPVQMAETLTLLGIEVDKINDKIPSESEGEVVFELSLTPNLGHCMSALGIARELSAALQIPLHPSPCQLKEKSFDMALEISAASLCPRYSCCLIEGVKVTSSPLWLQQQLEACGQKAINSVVDAVNYIMLKFGHPMHAFDADQIQGKKLIIGPAKHSLRFLCLDQIEREISPGTLLISDAHQPLAIAGIMGGAHSAVSEKTTSVLLEAAYFDPIAIRKGARDLNLRSESSQRFEKGVDPLGTLLALQEASHLIGATLRGVIDQKRGPLAPKTISYRPDRINQLLGTHLSTTEMEEIFNRLGFAAKDNQALVPLYRSDVSEEIDLVEEVARIYGYNNIEKKTPRAPASPLPNDPVFLFENKVRRQLAALGLTEFLTCDLISPKLNEVARSIAPRDVEFLQATYAKSEEYSILRTSLLPGLLQVTRKNLDQKNLQIAAFEIGRIHFLCRDDLRNRETNKEAVQPKIHSPGDLHLQERKVVEIPMGAILLSGKADLPHWSHKAVPFDFFDLKAMVERVAPGSLRPSQHLTFHPGRQADLYVGDLVIGSLGEVHPHLLEKLGIEQRVYYAEFDLLHLMKLQKASVSILPLPQFPSSERDWTLPLERKIPISDIFQAIYAQNSSLLERAELIDLYLPDTAGQKNVTFRFTYRDLLKTISFEEVEKEHAKIIEGVETYLLRKR